MNAIHLLAIVLLFFNGLSAIMGGSLLLFDQRGMRSGCRSACCDILLSATSWYRLVHGRRTSYKILKSIK